MTNVDYTTLLQGYFPNDFAVCDPHVWNMFVFCSMRWLSDVTVSAVPAETIAVVVQKTIAAAKVIFSAGGTERLPCSDADDTGWLRNLHHACQRLSNSHGPLLVELAHLFEVARHRGTLIGDSHVIANDLHQCLVAAHHGVHACEQSGCSWIGHVCEHWSMLPYESCPLLQPRALQCELNDAVLATGSTVAT